VKRGLMIVFLAVIPAISTADEPSSVSATLDRDRIAFNETVQLSIVFRGSVRPPDSLSLPLTNLKIVGGPSVETQFEWINGATSHSVTMTYVLAPLKVGAARVGAMKLRIGGKVFPTPDLDVIVAPATASPSPEAPAPETTGPFAVLIQTLDPPQPYAGQQSLWSLMLLTRETVQGVELAGLPDFHGCWTEELPQPSPPRPVAMSYEGRLYQAYPIARRALFASRPGTLTIGPVRATLALRIPATDIFRDFNLGETRTLDRTAPPLQVSVRGSNFDGPVGKFSLSASVDPARGRVGEPVTVRLTESGDGLLRSATPPPLRMGGARVYPPASRSSVRREATRVTNVREWSWIVVPQRAGPLAISPFELAYFDPSRARVATASAGPLALTIDPAAPPARPAAALRPAPVRPAQGRTTRLARALNGIGAAAAAIVLLAIGFALGRRGHRPGRPGPAAGATRDQRTAALLDRIRTLPARSRPRDWTAERAQDARSLEEEIQALRRAPELGTYDGALAVLEQRLEELERRAGSA
jgi:BatD DUF11 like domain